MKFGFLIDNRRCIGCHACSTACKSENEVPLGVSRTWVKYTETGKYPDATRHFQVTRCNHCENPPCVKICPVTAMYQRPDGIVEFDPEVCIGCKACIQACPYDAIHIDPNNGTAAKCHFCSHRTDIGLEPACVVVCPEHAILAGDLDDPNSEISRVVAKESVTVRKPEQGTKPKLFYVNGNVASQNPIASPPGPQNFMFTDPLDGPMEPMATPSPLKVGGRQAEHMIQVGYNAQHRVYWHWQVPAYIVTKDIASGIMMILPLLFLAIGFHGPTQLVGVCASLVMTLITTALLVFDLEKPERFLSILYRPQWRSWLARGAFVLVTFSMLVTALVGLSLGTAFGFLPPNLEPQWTPLLNWITLPLAILTSVYTAFLFGQAEGRDLWQHPLLPLQLLVRSFMGGAAVLGVGALLFVPDAAPVRFLAMTFTAAMAVDLGLTLTCETMMPHTTETGTHGAKHMMRSTYRRHFWWGFIGAGRVVPLLLAGLLPIGALLLIGSPLALVGLFLAEYAFVMAAQKVPNS